MQNSALDNSCGQERSLQWAVAVLCHWCVTREGLGHFSLLFSQGDAVRSSPGYQTPSKAQRTSAVSDLKARNHLCRQLKQVAVRKHAHLSLQCSKTKSLLSHTSVGCRQQPAAEFVPHTLATPRLEMTRPRWWWWDFYPRPRLCMCTYLKVRTSQTIKKQGAAKVGARLFFPCSSPFSQMAQTQHIISSSLPPAHHHS